LATGFKPERVRGVQERQRTEDAVALHAGPEAEANRRDFGLRIRCADVVQRCADFVITAREAGILRGEKAGVVPPLHSICVGLADEESVEAAVSVLVERHLVARLDSRGVRVVHGGVGPAATLAKVAETGL